MSSPFDSLRNARRAFKAKSPFVRRREYAILANKYSRLIDDLGWQAPLATEAQIDVRKTLNQSLAGEVCFFVTHAGETVLKPNVVAHIERLLAECINVVLIVNTDLPSTRIEIPGALSDAVAAIYIRQNQGFDFAAWAHAYALCPPTLNWTRLYLINDSIVGPVNDLAFKEMINRLRASTADFLGLVESAFPQPHMQSFFLAFGQRAYSHSVFQRWMANVRSLGEKIHVIDVYETRLTQVLRAAGLIGEALFPAMSAGTYATDDTVLRWEALLDAGFPFIKASVIKQNQEHAKIRQLIFNKY
jgi:lipopolysaccharide biosynthesis protein